jgi:hypothetical protein
MGKHEREEVETAERDVCARINGSESDANQELVEEAEALAKRLTKDFETNRCEHVGNEYGEALGDLVLHTGDGRKYVEVKFLSSGTGTRANMGQDSLTDYGLFEDDPLPWSEFRQESGFNKWRRERLNKFDYPEEVESVSGDKTRLYMKAKHLKNVLGVGRRNTIDVIHEVLSRNPSQEEKRAAQIVKDVYERANEGKTEYINYLMDFEQNENAIKKLTLLIPCGAHSGTEIEERWSLDLSEIIDIVDEEYHVYYVYKGSCSVEHEDHHKELRRIANGDVSLTSKEGQNSVFVSLNDGKRRSVLRMTYHWKNKFQGIQTPCINVFDEEFLN